MKDIDEWHKIGQALTSYFKICPCQRKLKTIVDELYIIYTKLINNDFTFTGTQWLIIAIMDRNSTAITHGTNCEYPIINRDDPFWIWLVETKYSPYLEDN